MNINNILIVGGAGYIGSHVAYLLHTLGYTITILDCLRYGQSTTALSPFARVVVGDVGNSELVTKLLTEYKIDAVVHCAALLEVGESVRDPGPFYTENVGKTQVLLDAMRACGVTKLVYSSSCAVYGTPTQVPITESAPFSPLSPYGNTKVAVEYLLHDYAVAYGLTSVSLRYFNAAGALPEVGLGEYHEPETHLIPLVLRALQHDKPFTIFGGDYDTPDGTAVRDYVHVHDIADAHAKALVHLATEKVSDAFNLGTGQGASVKEVVAAAELVVGKKANLLLANRRAGDPPRLVADPSRAHRLLNWQARHSSLAYVVQSAWRWEQALQARLEYLDTQYAARR